MLVIVSMNCSCSVFLFQKNAIAQYMPATVHNWLLSVFYCPWFWAIVRDSFHARQIYIIFQLEIIYCNPYRAISYQFSRSTRVLKTSIILPPLKVFEIRCKKLEPRLMPSRFSIISVRIGTPVEWLRLRDRDTVNTLIPRLGIIRLWALIVSSSRNHRGNIPKKDRIKGDDFEPQSFIKKFIQHNFSSWK